MGTPALHTAAAAGAAGPVWVWLCVAGVLWGGGGGEEVAVRGKQEVVQGVEELPWLGHLVNGTWKM